MSILLDRDSRILVQGMTGAKGRIHTAQMLAAGAAVVGGVNPRKAGTTVGIDGHELPVFGTVAGAVEQTGANVTVLFVPPKFAKSAMLEAVEAQVPLMVVITEGVPVHDTVEVLARIRRLGNVTHMVGPNCPGVITPGQSTAGIIPADITGPGPVGLVSKSGTLTYQLMHELADLGFTTGLGIGGDPVLGTTQIEALAAFERDPDTKVIVLIGEIGGSSEEHAAAYIADHVTKPVVAYIAGFTAPEGKTMGHAGAIVSGASGTAASKKTALEAAGVRVGTTPVETAQFAREALAAVAG